MRILGDKQNKIRLRTHMPKEALYKYVGANVNQQHLRMLPTTMNTMKDGEIVRLNTRRL